MVIKSLQQAIKALFNFRTWFVVLCPPLLTGFLLSVLLIVFWNSLSVSVTHTFSNWAWVQWLGEVLVGNREALPAIFSSAFLLMVFIPVLFVAVLLVTSIFVTPLVQREVAVKYFSNLEKKKGGSTLGSLANSLQTLTVFVVLFFLTLPLWLIPGMPLVIPAILVIWMNKKIFVYDVLQDYASKEERVLIAKKQSAGLWGLGALLVFASYIPFAFILLPVFSAFAYSFYGLNSLERLRNQA
ncbi:hypothetical protein AZI86_11235 [Bdellovibrio bacteriovorus]|uniref:EI24 domain-containing protein n=1 Tax=Bdellovibrio bacteriovorus TaxID=959 RepID=A0A150WL88_BDEBC|nr:EI24 domain-containing protein [Bdellovibrio bacteriovorus]KYG64771.1 hypothetical protein AZI86_11235 [Bdellovibrio bacteriovorus]